MKQIAEAINKVMQKVNWVAKNMTVGSWNNAYKWVADKDVKQSIREAMIENWLSLLPIWWTPKIQIDRWEQEEFYQNKSQWIKTKQSVFTDIETKYMLLHTSWESIEVYWYGQWVDTQDKWAGKATTYALKNTLLNMFLIPTWVDTDDTHSDDLEVPKKAVVKTQPKALISENESCPSCGVSNQTRSGTTKTWKPFEIAECGCWAKYFINRK